MCVHPDPNVRPSPSKLLTMSFLRVRHMYVCFFCLFSCNKINVGLWNIGITSCCVTAKGNIYEIVTGWSQWEEELGLNGGVIHIKLGYLFCCIFRGIERIFEKREFSLVCWEWDCSIAVPLNSINTELECLFAGWLS